MMLVYRVALDNQWNIPGVSEETVTQNKDPYGPQNKEIVESFFKRNYQLGHIFLNHILPESIPKEVADSIEKESKLGLKKKENQSNKQIRNKPAYISAFCVKDSIDY